jgi:hypothetical protein
MPLQVFKYETTEDSWYSTISTYYSLAGGYAVKIVSLLKNPSVPGPEYFEAGWK